VASRPFQFQPDAELELTEAAEWYEERKVIAIAHLRRRPKYWAAC
jgi:hypothetical protein